MHSLKITPAGMDIEESLVPNGRFKAKEPPSQPPIQPKPTTESKILSSAKTNGKKKAQIDIVTEPAHEKAPQLVNDIGLLG